jgi:hypothetical protein
MTEQQAGHKAEQADLERGYRRLLACYPRSFRRATEDEILAVLLDTAREGQRRVGLAETVDLLRGALRMHLGLSRSPRTVLAAIRLMYLGAAAELAALITIVWARNARPNAAGRSSAGPEPTAPRARS